MIDAGPERTQKLAYKTEEKNVDGGLGIQLLYYKHQGS